MRASRSWGVRPLLMLGYGGKRWSDRDRVLASALQTYEDGLCGGCGQPRDRAFNHDMDGWYETSRRTCQACATVERYRHESRDREQPAGMKVAVVDQGWVEGFTPNPGMLRA